MCYLCTTLPRYLDTQNTYAPSFRAVLKLLKPSIRLAVIGAAPVIHRVQGRRHLSAECSWRERGRGGGGGKGRRVHFPGAGCV